MMSPTSSNVLILGAGAAGLMAARVLAQGGRRVTILEARPRCGGRILPLPVATLGYPAEGGAEFIHGAAPLTRALLREAGLSSVPLLGRRWTLENGTWVPRASAPHEDRFLAAMKALTADLPIAAFVAQNFSGPDYELLRQMVLREVEGYNNADPRRFSTFALRDQWQDPNSERQERVVEGYGALVDFLQAQVQGSGVALHLGAEVTAIESDGDRVVARTRDGRTFAGAQAILTAPLPVLRVIALPSPLRERIAAADDAVGFGSLVKLHLRFRSRWWTEVLGEDVDFLFGAQVGVPVWWTQYPADHPVLTGWTSAYKVDAAAAARTDSAWLTAGIASLAALFDRPVAALTSDLVASHVTMWRDDPFARGAYSYPTPDSARALNALREIARGPVWLCGEALYTDGETGTVEAALASGGDAAARVLGL
jgi:monoamine oxidase